MAIVANAFPLLMVSSVSAIRGGKVFGAFLRIAVATVALFRFSPPSSLIYSHQHVLRVIRLCS